MRNLFLIAPVAFIAFGGGFIYLNNNTNEPFSFVYQSEGDKSVTTHTVNPNGDIENQKPLKNPPEVIKAIYSSGWTAGTTKGMDRLINLINETEINAIVVDIKDYSGVVSYDIQVPEVIKYGAREVRIPRINRLIKRFHDNGIYVIGRLTVFQDPALVKARPELAVKNMNTGKPWQDRKGISWIDPSSKEAWDYNISIAKDAYERGFDEINFDYIRFPSDGPTALMQFPFYDAKTTYKQDAIREFFQYLRKSLPGRKTSADLFGYTAINVDDLGIGQIIEYAYENFDYVAPMIYPSHYNANFLGYPKPATNPYEVVKHSMDSAIVKLIAWNEVHASSSKLRPWLQDFDLGGVPYDADKVRAQIKAVEASSLKGCGEADPLIGGLCNTFVDGWMLWDARNIYTSSALKKE